MTVQVLQGDCRDVLKTLDAESVQCVVTSPPYFGLRDYGTGAWHGGDEGCDHLNGALISPKSTLAGFTSENVKLRTNGMPFSGSCGKCGAERVDRQIGLERSPQEYAENLVSAFNEVWRVLRPDGTAWLNLGDSYSSGGRGSYDPAIVSASSGLKNHAGAVGRNRPPTPVGLKPKDLIGIPWRVAFALQEAGWYLRSDIVWAKKNVMPESVTDRPTRAHEYIFLLTKRERYFYDAEAIKEPLAEASAGRYNYSFGGPKLEALKAGDNPTAMVGDREATDGRNKRDVWHVATHPYPEAHFATFPEALIEPCILAGSRVGDTVLDPFGGSGTTGKVATKHRRNAVLIELNPEYCKLIDKRTSRVQQTLPMEEAV